MTSKNRFGRKVEFDGIRFDSQTESEFYVHLQNDPNVKKIETQPKFEIIEPYKVNCPMCGATGKILNPSSGNLNKCRGCKGSGKKHKAGAIYTADFRVTYQDGETEIIDVKGFIQRDFSLRKKLFEVLTGQSLVVVKKKRNQWVRE